MFRPHSERHSSAPLPQPILSLPPSLGGIGISSHLETAPFAYKAASSSRRPSPLQPALAPDAEPCSQRELCKEANHNKQNTLLAALPLPDRTALVEAPSQLGRKWLEAIPSSDRFCLTDIHIQANLHFRTLLPSYPGQCRHCPLQNFLGHGELCRGIKDNRTARHESVKYNLAAGIRAIPNVKVVVEPLFTDSNRRNDIRITFPGND